MKAGTAGLQPASVKVAENGIIISFPEVQKEFAQNVVVLFDKTKIENGNSLLIYAELYKPKVFSALAPSSTLSLSSSSSSSSVYNEGSVSNTSVANSIGKSSLSKSSSSSRYYIPSSVYSSSKISRWSSSRQSSSSSSIMNSNSSSSKACCDLCVRRKIDYQTDFGILASFVDIFDRSPLEKELQEADARQEKCCKNSIQEAKIDAGVPKDKQCKRLPDVVAKSTCVLKPEGMCCRNETPDTPNIPPMCLNNVYTALVGHGDSKYAEEICMPLLTSICKKNQTTLNVDGSYTCSLASNLEQLKKDLAKIKEDGCKITARLNVSPVGTNVDSCALVNSSIQVSFSAECTLVSECPTTEYCSTDGENLNCQQCKDASGNKKSVRCEEVENGRGYWKTC